MLRSTISLFCHQYDIDAHLIIEVTYNPEEKHELLQYKQILDAESEVSDQLRFAKAEKHTVDSWSLASTNNHDWECSDPKFHWDEDVKNAFPNIFSIKGPRMMQRSAINATMSLEDVFLIMPTGAGKSLVYQLPAALDGVNGDGLTLVVSPLLSLIEDQVYQMRQINVAAAGLSSISSKEEISHTYADMDALMLPNKGKASDEGTDHSRASLCMLYVTPERIAKSKRLLNKLEKLHAAGKLRRIVIDEAHCCSQWGNDFRPDYKQLGILRVQFPKVPIIAVTATATQTVWRDVVSILRIPKCVTFRAPIERPNLRYTVVKKLGTGNESFEQVGHFILTDHMSHCGIVYCLSQRDTEAMALYLRQIGIKAAHYHAYMPPEYRKDVHEKWLRDRISVLCCTVAFGMGINKKDVRYVIHHSLSKSVENYYQESGRAGRDGETADCVLLYRGADLIKQSTMVFAEATGLSKLYSLVRYCAEARVCRQIQLKQYFGQELDEDFKIESGIDTQHCRTTAVCDICASKDQPLLERDVTPDAKLVCVLLKAVANHGERTTFAKLVDLWRGLGRKKLMGSVKLDTAPKEYTKSYCERVLTYLLLEGVLKEDFAHTPYSTNSYLVTGPKAQLVERELTHIVMSVRNESPDTALSVGEMGDVGKRSADDGSTTTAVRKKAKKR
ncbi:hypothetical protein SARC_07963 [Sphaeroforma arctica JP610]|uniref:ATP-dependent DNA helicase n=1 Tax=Sphaeroforma arctica JP610 TaxID=667725 RepID=A0A0L0FUP6_9EUKA|nr:hypothetical protein SARC_07963 [Sphaeroforma arctica JP610]KNC79643.1 hypothetical protein SARC_07963 [Sphaeroforma arctica JP610]|eukprot:XP_014153545.1 hypothetical protein SARC_07963 [Sphaeroforma arctica JP610]